MNSAPNKSVRDVPLHFGTTDCIAESRTASERKTRWSGESFHGRKDRPAPDTRSPLVSFAEPCPIHCRCQYTSALRGTTTDIAPHDAHFQQLFHAFYPALRAHAAQTHAALAI